jgi:hypothetical protein
MRWYSHPNEKKKGYQKYREKSPTERSRKTRGNQATNQIVKEDRPL